MAEMKMDRELVLAVPFMLGSLLSLGILSPDFIALVDLGTVVYEGFGMALTWAHLLQIVPVAMILINREEDIRSQLDAFGAIEVWAVYVTLGLIIAPPFFPELMGTLAEQPFAYITFAIQTIGFGIISYIN